MTCCVVVLLLVSLLLCVITTTAITTATIIIIIIIIIIGTFIIIMIVVTFTFITPTTAATIIVFVRIISQPGNASAAALHGLGLEPDQQSLGELIELATLKLLQVLLSLFPRLRLCARINM